jgi:hypothetical protein
MYDATCKSDYQNFTYTTLTSHIQDYRRLTCLGNLSQLGFGEQHVLSHWTTANLHRQLCVLGTKAYRCLNKSRVVLGVIGSFAAVDVALIGVESSRTLGVRRLAGTITVVRHTSPTLTD